MPTEPVTIYVGSLLHPHWDNVALETLLYDGDTLSFDYGGLQIVVERFAYHYIIDTWLIALRRRAGLLSEAWSCDIFEHVIAISDRVLIFEIIGDRRLDATEQLILAQDLAEWNCLERFHSLEYFSAYSLSDEVDEFIAPYLEHAGVDNSLWCNEPSRYAKHLSRRVDGNRTIYTSQMSPAGVAELDVLWGLEARVVGNTYKEKNIYRPYLAKVAARGQLLLGIRDLLFSGHAVGRQGRSQAVIDLAMFDDEMLISLLQRCFGLLPAADNRRTAAWLVAFVR